MAVKLVNPACAGMILPNILEDLEVCRKPRVCGDDPS